MKEDDSPSIEDRMVTHQQKVFSRKLREKNIRLKRDSDVLKVQSELNQLLSTPGADQQEIERCRNWLRKNHITTGPPPPVDRRSNLRRFIEGDRQPTPTPRKHRGGLMGFLEKLQ